jgi:tetratricopeptide (TPR) repeat protein
MKKFAVSLLVSTFFAYGAPAIAQDATADMDASTDAPKKEPYKDEAVRHYNRGHDLHKQGFYNQAITEYRAALTADDRMEEAYTNIGLIYAAQKNYPKAMDAFKKSLAINPRRTNALNGLGTVLYARNKPEEAMQMWKKAVEIDPNFGSAYFNMGNALENLKDFKGAIDAYVSAIGINPSLADAYFHIGSIYAKQKHPAQAKLLLARAVELQPAGEFVREAKKTMTALDVEYADRGTEVPEVKMNIMAPPSAEK